MGYATLRPGYTLHVETWTVSQNAAENYSIIGYRRYVKKDSAYWYRGQWAANTERIWSNLGEIRNTSGWYYDFLNNTIQLEVTGTFRLNHKADGTASYEVKSYVNIVQIGSATATSGVKYPKTIATTPARPGKPELFNLRPTSTELRWAVPDSGGLKIDKYRVRWWPNTEPTGVYGEIETTRPQALLNNLAPGKDHVVGVWAHNASPTNGGWSPMSLPTSFFTPPGARVRVAGVWRTGVVFVKVVGVWRMAIPYIRKDGSWRVGS